MKGNRYIDLDSVIEGIVPIAEGRRAVNAIGRAIESGALNLIAKRVKNQYYVHSSTRMDIVDWLRERNYDIICD